ncbi:MAG: hypothetical protein HY674_09775 [Chloroflexi bacterium]|nr:hypothetical protein [Chloroflexota bacterium]
MKNKLAHVLALALFSTACGLVWFLMKLPLLLGRPGHPLPVFTQLCVSLRPIMFVLPTLAAAYCLCIWFRKEHRPLSWTGFFAVLTGVLVLVTLPAVIAAYLPLYDVLNHLPRNLFDDAYLRP